MHELQSDKAPQACMSCRKQKRKCSKTLPACTLCERMNRHCDYTNAAPPPSSEDFNALRQKLMELESRLNGQGMNTHVSPYATPASTTLATSDSLGPPVPAFTPPQEAPWQGIQNRFPAIAFLDSDNFKYGGYGLLSPQGNFEADIILLPLASSSQSHLSRYQLYVTILPCKYSAFLPHFIVIGPFVLLFVPSNGEKTLSGPRSDCLKFSSVSTFI